MSLVGATNWLRDQLPLSYQPAPSGDDPAEEMPKLATAQVFDLRYSNSMFDEVAAQAWMSPSGRFLVTTRRTIDRSIPSRLQIGLEVVLREMQVSDSVVEWRDNVIYRKSVGVLQLNEKGAICLLRLKDLNSQAFQLHEIVDSGFCRNTIAIVGMIQQLGAGLVRILSERL